MNTQVLHYKPVTGNANTVVFAIEERLRAEDLEKIAKNSYPVSIASEYNGDHFTAFSPVDIFTTDLTVGVLAEFISVMAGTNPIIGTLKALTGAAIMETYEGITGLEPDIVYLVDKKGG